MSTQEAYVLAQIISSGLIGTGTFAIADKVVKALNAAFPLYHWSAINPPGTIMVTERAVTKDGILREDMNE